MGARTPRGVRLQAKTIDAACMLCTGKDCAHSPCRRALARGVRLYAALGGMASCDGAPWRLAASTRPRASGLSSKKASLICWSMPLMCFWNSLKLHSCAHGRRVDLGRAGRVCDIGRSSALARTNFCIAESHRPQKHPLEINAMIDRTSTLRVHSVTSLYAAHLIALDQNLPPRARPMSSCA